MVTVDESTPAREALMARPSPTASRMAITCSAMNALVFSFFAVISLIGAPRGGGAGVSAP
jgi:hypothetical protein